MKYGLMGVVLMLSGCVSGAQTKESVGLANPASVYCAEQGGRVEIRKGANGETGYCHLPDGRVIEEWKFYRAQKGRAK